MMNLLSVTRQTAETPHANSGREATKEVRKEGRDRIWEGPRRRYVAEFPYNPLHVNRKLVPSRRTVRTKA